LYPEVGKILKEARQPALKEKKLGAIQLPRGTGKETLKERTTAGLEIARGLA
jgi:hypothetical protein